MMEPVRSVTGKSFPIWDYSENPLLADVGGFYYDRQFFSGFNVVFFSGYEV